jgi:tRNA(Ile2) C34 agmatinyltransferase TiaS
MDDDLNTPNCERCLVQMEPDGEEVVVWRCPECGLIRLTDR